TDGRTTPLDLADLCCGGDGTPRGRAAATANATAVDPPTGRAGALEPVGRRRGDGHYYPVRQLPIIDGCFIPDGRRGPVQVDSAGQTFGFPATSGASFNHIWAGGVVPGPVGYARPRTVLGGVDDARPGHGLLYMYGNKRLT